MITAINSVSVQNKPALKNRAQMQSQNFGALILNKTVFTRIQNEARSEFQAATPKLTTAIQNISMDTNVNEIKTPYMDFLIMAKVLRNIVEHINSGKQLTDEIVQPYVEMTKGEVKQGEVINSRTEAIQNLTEFHELFGKPDAPFDMEISAKNLTQNSVTPVFGVYNKASGINVSVESPKFSVAGIVQKTQEALAQVTEKKTALETKLGTLKSNEGLLSEKLD